MTSKAIYLKRRGERGALIGAGDEWLYHLTIIRIQSSFAIVREESKRLVYSCVRSFVRSALWSLEASWLSKVLLWACLYSLYAFGSRG